MDAYLEGVRAKVNGYISFKTPKKALETIEIGLHKLYNKLKTFTYFYLLCGVKGYQVLHICQKLDKFICDVPDKEVKTSISPQIGVSSGFS